ncbi:adenylate/guanylate cyclase domain-containing protein [Bradyrhizobium symbiodeficiens]|uniref:adenylate/guanylate cyclase domain-containing protein n=1 Tax=Bradyrhizobium symbiodeficiens TaxID=1404367 RepID=UPI00140FA3C6|nr:adenylate/guanylate cyclase domain-containing protein [Bradyrhizobium symbiodeficiens]QIO98820.1 adenylate/guanylate cyclase domain-containing protein [Bradyrhizobium symbiodeficiens]
MEADELQIHRRYRRLRVEVIDPCILSARGEIVKNTGDGFLATFESPADSLQSAVELQKEMLLREAAQPPERRIAFRIGIHWDPVIFDLNDVYGSGVNIAARLQTAAPAGGIVLSSALLEQISNASKYELDDLGELRLKNLTRSISAYSVRLPGVERSAAVGFSGKGSKPAKLPSLAILPFTSLSQDSNHDYFAEGFVDDIIATLSNLRDLLVVSRGSTISFARRSLDPILASEKLGVRYILSGKVRKSERNIRLSAFLTDLATGSVIWAEKYDAKIEDIFSVQDEIALAVVARVATHVRRAEVKRAMRKRPQSLNAYDHLLRSLDLLYKLDFASFSRARTFLEKAREDDNTYAAPFAFSAHWHMFNIAEGWSANSDAEMAEVMRLSDCALERDPSNALALALKGHATSIFYRDYDAALDCFDRALTISPNSSWAWMFSSATYGFIGEARSGIERAERAIRLSPLDQQVFVSYARLAQNHYLNDSHEDALRWSRKALSLNPRFGNAIRVAAASLVALGRDKDALLLSSQHRKALPQFKVSQYAPRCPFREPQRSLYLQRLNAAGIPD